MKATVKIFAGITGWASVAIWTSGLVYAQSWSWTRPHRATPAQGFVLPFNIKGNGLFPSHGPYSYISAFDALCWHMTFILPILLFAVSFLLYKASGAKFGK
jgi:hypothetical protein